MLLGCTRRSPITSYWNAPGTNPKTTNKNVSTFPAGTGPPTPNPTGTTLQGSYRSTTPTLCLGAGNAVRLHPVFFPPPGRRLTQTLHNTNPHTLPGRRKRRPNFPQHFSTKQTKTAREGKGRRRERDKNTKKKLQNCAWAKEMLAKFFCTR